MIGDEESSVGSNGGEAKLSSESAPALKVGRSDGAKGAAKVEVAPSDVWEALLPPLPESSVSTSKQAPAKKLPAIGSSEVTYAAPSDAWAALIPDFTSPPGAKASPAASAPSAPKAATKAPAPAPAAKPAAAGARGTLDPEPCVFSET